jgi:hypothetical protein
MLKRKKSKEKEVEDDSEEDDDDVDLDDSVHVPSIKKPNVIKYETNTLDDSKTSMPPAIQGSLRGDPRKKKKDLLGSNDKKALNSLGGSKDQKDEEITPPHPYNVMSIEEGAIQCKKEELDRIRRWTSQFLIRIYPKGLRIQSDNYNPLFYWMLGCQLVALNYQTPGFPMWLNEGKFMRAKNSGYILKPGRMHGKVNEKNKTEMTYLTIEVISSWRLPRPWGTETLYSTDKVGKPKVEVSLWDPYTVAFNQYGADKFNKEAIELPEEHHLNRELFNLDEKMKKEKAKAKSQSQTENSVVDDTLIMPYIQYAVYKAKEGNPHSDTYSLKDDYGYLLEKKNSEGKIDLYFQSTDQELDMVVFKVTDESATSGLFLSSVNNIIGYYAITVADMREGFRVVPLKGENGVPLPHGELLVYIRKHHHHDI